MIQTHSYEAPALLELGRVEKLTFGCACGIFCDCDGKKRNGQNNDDG